MGWKTELPQPLLVQGNWQEGLLGEGGLWAALGKAQVFTRGWCRWGSGAEGIRSALAQARGRQVPGAVGVESVRDGHLGCSGSCKLKGGEGSSLAALCIQWGRQPVQGLGQVPRWPRGKHTLLALPPSASGWLAGFSSPNLL